MLGLPQIRIDGIYSHVISYSLARIMLGRLFPGSTKADVRWGGN